VGCDQPLDSGIALFVEHGEQGGDFGFGLHGQCVPCDRGVIGATGSG
jgi:hypothetical protein